jgi:hypothetical protein
LGTIIMMDFIRRMQGTRRRSPGRFLSGGPDEFARRLSLRRTAEVDLLERRELLATVQDFNVPGTGTPYTLQQAGLGDGPTVVPGGPFGNFLQLTRPQTTPVTGVVSENNSISFNLSDVGTYNHATANFDFQILPGPAGSRGNGLGFALLNTGTYGLQGAATSALPQAAFFANSLGVGFVTSPIGSTTTDNSVIVSFNAAPVHIFNIPKTTLDLASGFWTHAQVSVDFLGGTVSIVLTPPSSVGSPYTVTSGLSVPGLAPYQSRVNYGAAASGTAALPNDLASTGLDNVNVQYTGLRQSGRIAFGSSSYTVPENAGFKTIDLVRAGGTAGSFTVEFVTADGTAMHGLNYQSITSTVTFAEGQTVATVDVPILDDGVYNGDKTVNLYISNPTLQAPLGTPIDATLTIVNTNPYMTPPTVSPRGRAIFFPGTRRVQAFQLTFSTPMDPASAQNLQNYTVLTPANRYQSKRTIALSQAVLDPTGTVVTLYRVATDRTHLSKSVRILVRGRPFTGLTNTAGTYLAGVNGQAGTDAEVVVHF